MKSGSLGLRLILLACASISISLVAAGFMLSGLFHQYFEERLYRELENQLNQLTANLALGENDSIVVGELPDPRFRLPFSGLYWQVIEQDGDSVFSRSLWGEPIAITAPAEPGVLVRDRDYNNPDEPLLIVGREILLGDPVDPRVLDLTVAVSEEEVYLALNRFRYTLTQWLALMFVFLILASWIQVRLGLSPLEAIREKINAIRGGHAKRLTGEFPAEVMPLADEVNELLELHETSLETARSRASDLAHGLKTPLTIMLALAKDIEKAGQPKIADDITQQVNSMNQYVERELARSRLQVPAGLRTRAKPVIQRMADMIAKLPRDEPLDWQVDIPETLDAPFDEHDLSELMGNMLDNARKWAKSVVVISGGTAGNETQHITVEDDGPGVPEDMIETILSRGGRLDENVQGTGLGLAICADMAREYGADLTLEKSELGGLKVSFIW